LHQNRSRFAIALSDAEGEIEREYERSLATLLPIKRELARTGVLIDKIYGNILPAAQRFFERVEPKPDEEIDEVLTRIEAQAMRTWALRMRYSPISL